MIKIQNFINGEFCVSSSNQSLDVFEPATGNVYASVPDSNNADVEHAILSAQAAFKNWSILSVQERASYLDKIANRLESRLDEFAEYESRDTGKPISLATSIDIPRAVSNFRFFADYGQNFQFESTLASDESKNTIIRYPLGVVGCISPWNLPLYLFTWKIAPALISGNTVVAKPSEITPFTAFKLGEICQDVGLPPGVLNIIQGQGSIAGDALVNHPIVEAISFTGGTATGKIIAQSTATSFKKLSLEMGGKNPAVVFADCNFEKTVDTLVRASFSNQGQICLCSSRILIEKSIYEQFKRDFVQKVKLLKIGDPNLNETQFGAVSSKGHFDKIMNSISGAKIEGGIILTGGNQIQLEGRCENGWFVEPTIIEGLSNTCETNQQEIFGPVVTLQSFSTEEEAVQLSNDIDYGLSATIWTEDEGKAHRVSNLIDAGVIWVNCWLVRDLRTPFGGMKQSGLGREGGEEAMMFFTEPKTICSTNNYI